MSTPKSAKRLAPPTFYSQDGPPPHPDRRPIVVLRMTKVVSIEALAAQQAAASTLFEPFGLRPLIIPIEVEFSGVIPQAR